MTLHQFFYWHKEEWRILSRNKDGSVAEIACARCTCPKDALGYTCQHRMYYHDYKPTKECGLWKDFEVYDRGYDGEVVGHRDPFNA